MMICALRTKLHERLGQKSLYEKKNRTFNYTSAQRELFHFANATIILTYTVISILSHRRWHFEKMDGSRLEIYIIASIVRSRLSTWWSHFIFRPPRSPSNRDMDVNLVDAKPRNAGGFGRTKIYHENATVLASH